MPYISHESLVESRKVDYYIALGKSQQTWKTDNEDVFPWIEFFLWVIKKQAEDAVALSNWENIWIYLSEKQSMIRNYITEHHPYSRKEIIEWTWLWEWTVKQVISKLINMWKIIRFWETRGMKYDIK